MKTWEIVKGMFYGEYKEGDIFQNSDMYKITITKYGELCYLNYEYTPTVVRDYTEWELINR